MLSIRPTFDSALQTFNATLQFDAFNETAETAENYCRNIIQKDTNPMCLVSIVQNNPVEGIEECEIPDCEEGTVKYFENQLQCMYLQN